MLSENMRLAQFNLAQTFETKVTPAMVRILKNLNESRSLTVLRDSPLPRLGSGLLRVGSAKNQVPRK